MQRHVPNGLTISRLFLAAAFFLVLNQYRYHGPGHPQTGVLFLAIGLFILAAVTDALDGYLARKWKVESTFGRIVDPFCDKVLIIGAFIYLAGPRFVIHEQPMRWLNMQLDTVTGVYPWMVVVILARELLVTGIRGELEGAGIQFPAIFSGKLKMILQSVGIPVILFVVWLDPQQPDRQWLGLVQHALAYGIVGITFISGIPYIQRAARVLRRGRDSLGES